MAAKKIRYLVRELILHSQEEQEIFHLHYLEGVQKDSMIVVNRIFPYEGELADTLYFSSLILSPTSPDDFGKKVFVGKCFIIEGH